MSSRSVLILLSGGYDSLFMLNMSKADGHATACLFIDYGQQAAQQEQQAAERACADHGVALYSASITLAESSITPMNGPSGAGPRVVPGRNLALIGLAVNHAASEGYKEVWIGATADDVHDYADCRSGFIMGADAAARAYGVQVCAPLIRRRRSDLVEMVKRSGWVMSAAFSCYSPDENGKPCGDCNSCAQPA